MATGMSSSSAAAAAAAPSSSSSSQKNSNFARLCWLLIDTGTQVLREVFDNIHKPTSLHAVLHSTSIHNTLKQLKSRRILNDQQWSKLYPSRSTSVSSASFDVTLLFALLRNICNLTPPPTGWDKPPATSDLSKEADLARIKLYRNEVYAHRTETAVSAADFETLWTNISTVLIRLGGQDYKTSIQRLKVEPMDSDDEKYFIKMLEEWKQLGNELLEKMDKVLRVLKGGNAVAASASEAEEYTRRLKSSIKRQTESLPALEDQTPVSIDDVFTNVTIQRVEKDQEKTKLGKKQFDVFQASSTTLKKCSEMFIWPENDDPNSRTPATTNPKCILITGVAGIGKSEYLKKVVWDWADDQLLEKDPKYPDLKFAFKLKFSHLNLLNHEELDLCDILNRSSLLDAQSIIDKGLLQYMIENPEKVLIIFDGYDEYRYRTEITGDFETKYPNDPRHKMPVPAMIAKIMKGKILKDSVVMISSRPEEAQELLPEEAQKVKKFPFDVKCEIQGFSPLQVQEFIQKYFKNDESIKKKVLEHIQMNEILLSFGHTPVMCYLMCYYLKWHMTRSQTTENLPVTRSELYYEVIKVFITRHSYTEMTEPEVGEILHKLAELAIYLVRVKKIIFSEEDMIKSFNFSEQELTNLKKSGLFDCCPGVKKSPFDKPPLEFVFSHLTMQEFLCALGFVEKKQLPEKKGTSEVIWTFMAGLLRRKKDEKLMDQLIEKIKPEAGYDSNKVLTLHCLYEYRDDELSKRVINKLHDKYCDSDGWISFGDVNDLDCLAIRYFLYIVQLLTVKQTTKHLTSTQSFIVNTLDIGWSSLSPSGVSVLCESLSNIPNNVTGLVLLECDLDDECVKIIAQTLNNTRITNLDLARNWNITAKGIRDICAVLSDCSVETLDLTGCGLDDECVKIIAETLNNTKINQLTLQYNNITDEGVMCLCDVVSKRDCPVKVLVLYGNDEITDNCKISVRELTKQNKPDVMIQLEFGDHTDDEGDKQETRNSRKFTVPPEIIARGPNAVKAYQQAIKEGKVQVYRGRIMLIGQDRAGKTSLKKSLLGLKFDPKEPSTVGVDVDPSRFSVDVDSAIEWKKLEGTPMNDFDDKIARVTAEKLNKERQDLGKPEPEPEPDVKRKPEHVAEKYNEPVHDTNPPAGTTTTEPVAENSTTPNVLDINRNDDSNSSEDDVKTTPKTDEFETVTDRPSEEVTERIIQYLSAKKLEEISPEDKVTVSIWDFAGQQLYYVSHPVFLSPRAVYLLVYNLSKDLKDKAVPCVRQGIHDIKLDNHEKQTNLEAILSWLVSVHSVRPQDDGKSNEGDELPYLRPPVVMVGTHADCPFGDIKVMEAIIQKSLSRKSYNKHVVNPFIAVNNVKSSDDEGVHKLKNKVKELFGTEPYMKEYVPVRWFTFEKAIKILVNEKEIDHLPLEELGKVVRKSCRIEDQDEIEAMLNFYHDLGVIVKYGKTVVLKAEWLIDVFKRLITIRPFNEQDPQLRECWEKLEEKGILDMKLVRHVFKDLIGRQGSRTEEDILAMMEQYGLIAKFGTESNFHYFVPAQLQSSPAELLDTELKASDPCALYIHFPDGFVPHGLYYCLVSKVIAWCSENKYLQEPKLYKNVSQFAIGCSHEYKLKLICRKPYIKVVLRSLQEGRSPDIKPARSVRKHLENCLEVLKNNCHGYCSMTYKISVLCPLCATSETECRKHKVFRCCDDDCLHLLPVEDPDNLVLFCGKTFDRVSDVPGLDEWYRDPLTVRPQVEVSSTLKLNDNQKRWLVIGICLNVVLLPPLREFMKTKMGEHYCDLKTNHNIDNQVFNGRLTREGKCHNLNYCNINNNNTVKDKSNYDYKVKTAVDLAKLYLSLHMAKFEAFDETCDLSAVLGILCSAGVFKSSVKICSKYVRQEVRNEWGHCDFLVWDETKFTTCFQMMDLLLKALNLPSDDKKTISDELKDWKEKGVELCMGNMVKAESVKVMEESVVQLCREFKRLVSNGQNEALRVLEALQPVQKAIEEFKKEIESLKERVSTCEDNIKELNERVKVLKPASTEPK